MSDYGVLPSRARVPHVPLTCTQCSTPIEYLAPNPSPPTGTPLRIRCYKCSAIITHHTVELRAPVPNEHSSSASSSKRASGTSTPQPRKRKIGTQERPLETAYYEILGVEITATTDEIKKHHPDKNRDDPSAEETRTKYCPIPSYARNITNLGPRRVRQMRDLMHCRMRKVITKVGLEPKPSEPPQRDAKGREIISPEERARREEKRLRKEERERQIDAQKQKARSERVSLLVTELSRKLSIYTESATGHPQQDSDVANSWRQICEIEAKSVFSELKGESYGVELLNAIGFVYVSKAKHYLATNQTFMGVGGWLHNIQGKYHVFINGNFYRVSTVRSALELKQVFDQIAEAEKSGMNPEQKKKLEEQAAEKVCKTSYVISLGPARSRTGVLLGWLERSLTFPHLTQGLRALFKGAKLEIESVLRETCDRVLADPTLQSSKLHLRAEALQILGEAYLSVKKDGDATEEDYVRIETNASRQRAANAGYT
ncbi:chaperone regulator [Rhizoctonia solani AG-1 IA]|uniref:Chaperone regulator n=1 Tax=Thanatephorus cucumeris (strain AG1-IA) TaxID=983506 RepID=L8WEW0_THACA|nr:chaperone regulator [Rhizoctonia solani AG-1 IA]